MVKASGHGNRTRIQSAAGVAAVHALLAGILIAGLGFSPIPAANDPLKIFEILPQQPPPPPVFQEPPAVKSAAPEGAAAPPALKAEASPVVAPPPEIRLEAPPLLAVAPLAGLGSDVSLGAAPVEGPGTGGGGEGSGTGAGGEGEGPGSGGAAIRTRRIAGGFTNRDYPRAAAQAGAQGTVVARLEVGETGRVADCRVRISSGNTALDRATCALILKRFRFEPARDAQGRAVTDIVEWEQVWSLERRDGPEAAEAQCRAQADKLQDRAARRSEFFACMAALGWSRR